MVEIIKCEVLLYKNGLGNILWVNSDSIPLLSSHYGRMQKLGDYSWGWKNEDDDIRIADSDLSEVV